MYPSLRIDEPTPIHRFDLIVSDAPAREVYLGMVADTPYSILLPNDLDGNITVSLKLVSVPEALEALRTLYGYEYRVDGRRIFIQSRKLQTRILKLDYLNAVRKGASDIRVISGSVSDVSSGSSGTSGTTNSTSTNPTSFVTSKISTTANNDFWSELRETLAALVGEGEGRGVMLNPQSGILVVRAFPAELAQVEEFLRVSQLALTRQVVIEAKIVEVALSDQFQAGINWGAFGSASSPDGRLRFSGGQLTPGSTIVRGGISTTSPISGTAQVNLANSADAVGSMFGLVLSSANFTAVLNLLEEQGQVHVLSSPRVATLNNQKAVLKVGSDDFFVTGVDTNSNTNANGSSVISPKLTLQPFFSGISLDVTPQIDDRGGITLHIHPMVSKVSSVTQEIDLGELGNFRLPLASSEVSEMDSVVRALNGQMIVLGGLIRQGSNVADSQVPGLGDVPVLGNLFKQKSRDAERRELVILLRPSVIQSNADWRSEIDRASDRVGEILDGRWRGGTER
ncbi:MAG: pilus (MSHA type) biogenesis protein MshL [Candidatus Dactylopiibacterium carminicum]|uniref:Type IV pilus biogenesis and competence protein PilQ n=1 Tax=Candidatus Dactylopiibacterium carminicum TaxID=857335 RepID=A0A272ET32_9RHOO|nr:pilus (MSHA type) biogenesis protein MshL [Candidatus Dactylopiibacterium carminicum]KAF7599155.1 pilus (MSHA type) biogenesis protein MshL [Candidatus Dactylopiibacterium carminicum]PAS93273.1 MAG: pilus (MSHA type) biogenesis protein MshL [Candidatus Dactylopiibacterium carminicum]PAS99170.1 MAG: pilus (MSHA type) biogenesis protein MshL [Candidatus Dactylopiibacterium carminicum]